MASNDYSEARHSPTDDRRLSDYLRFCKVHKITNGLQDMTAFDWAWNRQQERLDKVNGELASARAQLTIPLPIRPIETSAPTPKAETPKEKKPERVHPYPDVSLKEMERVMVLSALQRYEGNKTHTAIALGVTVKTLYNKITVYGLTPDMWDEKKEKAEA